MTDLFEHVRALVADVLDISERDVHMESACGELAGWDSLAHLRLMTALEEEFGVRPSMAQISDTKTVAHLIALVSGAAL